VPRRYAWDANESRGEGEIAAKSGAASLTSPPEIICARPVAPRPPGIPLIPPAVETNPPADVQVLTQVRSASDFMVDVVYFPSCILPVT
jgi:hypothetical protein